MFIHLSFASGGIDTRVTITAGDALRLVLHFSDSNFGPNMSSATMMQSLVTGKYGSLFLLIILS